MSDVGQTDEGYRLQFGRAATVDVMALLHNAACPHLQDVRAMLRLPLPTVGITAGCNFAAVQVLLNVLSGLSRLMGPGHQNSGKHFTEFVRRRYPWKSEPIAGYAAKKGTDALYNYFRNGFAHDLGLMLETRTTKSPRVRLRLPIRENPQIGVSKKPTLTANELIEVDTVAHRPTWLNPTVRADDQHGVLVDAVALYWGTRRLIFDHTDDPRLVKSLQHMVDRTWNRKDRAGLVKRYGST